MNKKTKTTQTIKKDKISQPKQDLAPQIKDKHPLQDAYDSIMENHSDEHYLTICNYLKENNYKVMGYAYNILQTKQIISQWNNA